MAEAVILVGLPGAGKTTEADPPNRNPEEREAASAARYRRTRRDPGHARGLAPRAALAFLGGFAEALRALANAAGFASLPWTSQRPDTSRHDDSLPNGVEDNLRSVMQPKLLHKVLTVGLDCVRTQLKNGGGFFVGFAF